MKKNCCEKFYDLWIITINGLLSRPDSHIRKIIKIVLDFSNYAPKNN